MRFLGPMFLLADYSGWMPPMGVLSPFRRHFLCLFYTLPIVSIGSVALF